MQCYNICISEHKFSRHTVVIGSIVVQRKYRNTTVHLKRRAEDSLLLRNCGRCESALAMWHCHASVCVVRVFTSSAVCCWLFTYM